MRVVVDGTRVARHWQVRYEVEYDVCYGALFARAINQSLVVMAGRVGSRGRGRAGDIQCRKSRQLLHLCCSGEFYLGFPRSDLQGVSWYRLLHWECTREAQTKHRLSKYYKNHVNAFFICHSPFRYYFTI